MACEPEAFDTCKYRFNLVKYVADEIAAADRDAIKGNWRGCKAHLRVAQRRASALAQTRGLEDYAKALGDLAKDLESIAAERNVSKWLERTRDLNAYLSELPLKAFMECACGKKLFELKR
jgi:hypothetical protein